MNWFTNLINKKLTLADQTGVNKSNFEHALFAGIMQIVIGLISGNWFAGGCFGVAFFLGREHAQAQAVIGYSLAKTFQAFDVRKWSLDSQLDLLFPVIACVSIYVVSINFI